MLDDERYDLSVYEDDEDYCSDCGHENCVCGIPSFEDDFPDCDCDGCNPSEDPEIIDDEAFFEFTEED